MRKLENQRIRKFGNQQMGSDKKGFLMKKCYEKGGGSLQRAYRKLIRILDDWYRKGV